jgi:lactoylglutathione lyase
MKGISSLAHVAIKTRDLDASLDFYVNRMGFREMLRLDKPDGSPGVWLVYLRITDDQFLEIFPEGQGERAPGWNDTAINHICLGVDGIDAVVAELGTAGVPLLLPRKAGADGNIQAWVEDPDGNRIELMQMMPGNLQEKAIARLRREARDEVPA